MSDSIPLSPGQQPLQVCIGQPTRPTLPINDSKLPLCWGHRGASAAFPENTLHSFEAAIKDGAEGIESDVHISTDDVVLMFHDPSLERTTDGKGKIASLPYFGGIDAVRTLKAPHQKIPTFDETMDMLMRKENQHVIFNIDCKPNNDPERLFRLIKASIERFEDHASLLIPRLVLGLWHPKFLEPSTRLLPDLKRSYIGMSTSMARKYFWDSCQGFSMQFSCLFGREGLAFREDCKRAGKFLLVWTVNERKEMIQACKWGVDAILTDRTADYLTLRQQMKDNWGAVATETSALSPYSSYYNSLASRFWGKVYFYHLTRSCGPFRPITTTQ
ncbi:hypothetical protein PCANC_09080 [Puccinia coronata f. sp. avenae]|uniref:GP-PDE domain-containing protein n=1 Tax=Puccinia coronata f. sp. avenae TaxID=200324 RepID=A0A2N5SWX8_9BASI|nr:hypothetical protein PCANC_09080 [Puccinia coronata f. sp. avenae]PLW24733.1 hypothetical protein PCASD_05210 [Puccinia coronata f. sp. avenae]PLW51474.1 hypothetical protein PCASD_00342 [Puccinia coronata f. sp. avenae]